LPAKPVKKNGKAFDADLVVISGGKLIVDGVEQQQPVLTGKSIKMLVFD
jgi:hypothetical protein